jgi:hypothetical protein
MARFVVHCPSSLKRVTYMKTEKNEQRPQPTPNLIWREVEDGAVLITPDGRVQALNHSGGYIWSLVAAGQTVAEMKCSLLSQYGIPEDEAETDLLAFLAELTGAGMIEWLE